MTDAGNTWRRRSRVWLAATVGGVLVRALASTWRYHVVGGQEFEERTRHGGRIGFVLWHGELLPLSWYWRGRGVRVLISTHADGEIIARILQSVGYTAARGSTTRDGTRGLRELIGALRDDKSVALTPDGPRGPRHSFASGILIAAQRTGTPLILGRAVIDRAWVLRSWDRFVIPKPFARIEVRHSPLIHVTGDDLVAESERCTRLLEELAPDTVGTS